MPRTTLDLRRLSGALGAEVLNVDLTQPLDGALAEALRAALLEHLVLFFREQALTPAQFMAFAERFGEPVDYPFLRSLEGYPHVIEVLKREDERVNFGGVWHSDTTYLERPPMGSLLLAQEVQPYGGDTLFANQYLAYEALSDGMRRMLDGLVAVSSSTKADASRTREDRLRDSGARDAPEVLDAEHPVVRTHPETGRKALYVNLAHTVRFAGMTEEESAPLLGYLFQHQVRPEFTCRFPWAPGSLAFWDNRAAQHNAINDYAGFRRRMLRITLAGDRPR
jgi:taurine dioxygenase